MLKRNVAVAVVVAVVLGGGAVAWARGTPERPTLVRQAATTEAEAIAGDARRAPPGAGREAVRSCLEAATDAAARQACRAKLEAAGRRRPAARGGPGGLGRAVHGELLVPAEGGGFETVSFDRGTVHAATDDDTIVVDRADGAQVSVSLTADTRYRGVDGPGQLKDGKPAHVVHRDGKARLVVQGNKMGRPGVPEGKG